MRKPIRVVIANNAYSFVRNLVIFLRPQPHIQVVGVASDGPGAIESCAETLPDVALISLFLAGVDGIRTTRSVLQTNAQIGVLIITPDQIDGLNEYAMQAMKMGAKGFLSESASPEIITQAIQQVYEGEAYVPFA